MKLPVERERQGASLTSHKGLHTIDGSTQLDPDYRRDIRLGLWILVLGFGGFIAWAMLAPLDEGVPAQGTVSVESKRKRIDHLSGGIVEKILVRDGQVVREGEELIVLNEIQARAGLNATESQWRVAVAAEARLRAEREGLSSIRFPKELEESAEQPEVAAAMRAQSELFRSRRAAIDGELAILRESVRGLELQLRSLDQLKAGREKQVQLFNEQLNSFQRLNAQGFISRNQLLDTERQLAEIQSKQSEDLANIAGIKARLADFRMRGAQREIEFRREVETQLTEMQREAATLSERRAAARDVHARLVLRAPVSGTVVELAFHTIGGVVKPGDRIMDIVPAADELIVEARVLPQYIDRLRPGLPADVHFDAYMNRADRVRVSGTVDVVSADALVDSRTGASYYAMRITVPAQELEKLGELKLQSGMQGTVMVKTGARTLMTYLVRPLMRRFTSGLSER